MLEQVGMRVTIAENGRRAIEILTAGEAVFDAVLMDLQMPEVDGLTAARAIMSDAAFRDLPIVAITANAFEDDRRRSLEAGMAAQVRKPVATLKLSDRTTRGKGKSVAE